MAAKVEREKAGEEEEEGGSSRDEVLVRLRECGSNAENAGDAVGLGARDSLSKARLRVQRLMAAGSSGCKSTCKNSLLYAAPIDPSHTLGATSTGTLSCRTCFTSSMAFISFISFSAESRPRSSPMFLTCSAIRGWLFCG